MSEHKTTLSGHRVWAACVRGEEVETGSRYPDNDPGGPHTGLDRHSLVDPSLRPKGITLVPQGRKRGQGVPRTLVFDTYCHIYRITKKLEGRMPTLSLHSLSTQQASRCTTDTTSFLSLRQP